MISGMYSSFEYASVGADSDGSLHNLATDPHRGYE
jgi:hypothetical protein